jgi:hypothetical protein
MRSRRSRKTFRRRPTNKRRIRRTQHGGELTLDQKKLYSEIDNTRPPTDGEQVVNVDIPGGLTDYPTMFKFKQVPYKIKFKSIPDADREDALKLRRSTLFDTLYTKPLHQQIAKQLKPEDYQYSSFKETTYT